MVRSKPAKRGTRRKSKALYGQSDKHAIIDSTVHPLADNHWLFVIVDGLLHAAVEKNPEVSLEKFVRYNLLELLKRIIKEQK